MTDGHIAARLALGLLCAPAAASAAGPGCFAGQARNAVEERTAASVVGVAVADPAAEGLTFKTSGMGTGFAVAGSGDASNPHKKVVTAFHVGADAPESGPGLVVLSSSGAILGRARVVARSRSAPERGRVQHPGSDVAVLAVEPLDPDGGLADFDALPGIRLAPVLPASSVLIADFAVPSGLDHGDSGAPMTGADGSVFAVVTGFAESRRPRSAVIRGGDLAAMNEARAKGAGGYVEGMVALDAGNVGVAETLADRDVLAALGAAGRAARSDPGFPGAGAVVAVFGIPDGICAVHRAVAVADGPGRAGR